jgi:MbtH protein
VTEVRYTVVINDAGQWSIWPLGQQVPAGWREVGMTGAESECLAHIERNWTDPLPRRARSSR